jgi:CspA family cold shock protein
MSTGTVKWFNDQKGYGFISRMTAARTCSSTSAPCSVRASTVLAEGQKISYELETDRRTGKQSAGDLKPA